MALSCKYLIPKQISKLTNIVSFNLGGNSFTKFPNEICSLTSLDELSMSSSKLSYVSSKIGKLKNLRILIFNFNQIKSLPKEIGQLTQTIPVMIYGLNLLAVNIIGFLMLTYISRNPQLASPHFTKEVFRKKQVPMYICTNSFYVIAIILSPFVPVISYIIYIITIILLIFLREEKTGLAVWCYLLPLHYEFGT